MANAGGRLLRGAARAAAPDWLRAGGQRHGFRVREVFAVTEFDMVAYHLEHERTGARYVHMDCDDTNNAFAVAFRTPAVDSTGLPHILEHTVLCGSERFPVRDPFFNMTKRSLNTFMNALTASDHTMYPFATRNEQDFENLMKVYLDAVFFPNLERMDFLQEGHRLERDPDEPSRILRTGVVYNEMKGTLGSASTIFYNKLQEVQLPGTQYANISGGDPPHIAELTHERLVEFHKQHYHPSNALLFTYGDLPLERHLALVDEWALSRFEFSQAAFEVHKAISDSRVDVAQRPGMNHVVRVKGPPEPMLDKHGMYCLSRVLSDEAAHRQNEYDRMVGRILSTLLLDGPSAPLYTALIDSQVAPDFSPGTGYDGSSLHPTFGIGAQGIAGDDASIEVVKTALLNSLREIAVNGLDERRVEAVLHQVELSMKQRSTNFGMVVMHAIASAFAHSSPSDERSLIHALNESVTVNGKIERLVQEMRANPLFWQEQLIQTFLIKDPTTGELIFREDLVAVAMDADVHFVANQEAAEKENLAGLAAQLGDGDMLEIDRLSRELAEAQAQEQDPSCLPTLSVREDVPRIPEEMITYDDVHGDHGLLWINDQKTNGVVYFRALFDTSEVPVELLPLLSLFTSLLGNVDAGDMSYQDLSVESDLVCDGMSYAPTILPWYGEHGADSPQFPRAHQLAQYNRPNAGNTAAMYRQGVIVSSFCLARNLDKTVDLLGRVLGDSRFGSSMHHLESLLSTSVNSASSNITNGALGYARKWALASLGGEHARREALTGLSQIELLFECSQRLGDLVPAFEFLLDKVFRPEKMSMSVVAGGADIDRAKVLASLARLRSTLGEARSRTAPLVAPSGLPGQGLVRSLEARDAGVATYIPLPISVHNAAVSLSTEAAFGHQDDAAMMVAAQLMSSNFLHRHIREQGGAYGGGGSHDMGGQFSMYSYYDPRSDETLRVFARAAQWVCDGSFAERDVEEALLSVFGSIDSPQEVRTKGSGPFLYGVTQEQRQGLRDRFFAVNRDSVVEAARRHLGHIQSTDAFLAQPLQGVVAIAGNSETKFVDRAVAKSWELKDLQGKV